MLTVEKNIPKKLKEKYLLNSHKNTVQFQLLRADIKRNRCPRANVPGKDIIFDSESGEAYEIYYNPKTVVEDGIQKVKYDDIWVGPETLGIINCNLKTRRGKEMYEYLCMSNYNQSNLFRDKAIKPVIRMINAEAEAKKEIEEEEEKIKAQAHVIALSTEGLRVLADWMGLNSTESAVVLKRNLMTMAKKRTSDFNRAVQVVEEDGEFLSAIIRGQRHNIIEAQRSSGRWRWTKDKVFFASYNTDEDHTANVIQLARHFKDGESSGKHYNRLIEELEKFKGLYQA